MVSEQSSHRKHNNILFAVFAAAFIWACSACITDTPVTFHPDMDVPPSNPGIY